jgi:EmrB/QacA subfamily drug resistance transporter
MTTTSTRPAHRPAAVAAGAVGGAHRRPSGRGPRPVRRGLVLAVVLLAALAINIDTTIVNVALPSLNRELGSSTSGLQWVVDGYNLAFAALVLAGGNIGDRYGRRGALALGLLLFAGASVWAGECSTTGELITARFAMGAAASLVYPTTLSVITNLFRERGQRAAAIGAWGAVSGLGVAIGPILGGALLENFRWGSIFLALVPVALIAAVGTLGVVPISRDTARPPLDPAGLVLSVLALGSAVYTIIEAPGAGWLAARTLGGFAVALVALAVLIAVERWHSAPMLDIGLFANPRFAAASGAVTVAFFALFGFIFLITQFFQQLQGHGPLATGVRILPVAGSIAVGSLLGIRLAVTRFGTKFVVAAGLLSMTVAFVWISTENATVPYLAVAAQMVLLGGGLGLTSATATESIMGVVRPDQAGAGSAVNDATRQVGGALGVAVLGSVFASLYVRHLNPTGSLAAVPAALLERTHDSFGAGLAVAAASPAPIAAPLHDAVVSGFLDGLQAGCLTAAGVCALGIVAVLLFLPARPTALSA